MSGKRDFETVLKWIVVVILAVVALKLVFTVLGFAFFIGGVLLFRVLPLVLLAWIVYKVVQWVRDSNGNGSTPTTV